MSKDTSYADFDPWIQLAAAICDHGIQENDTSFLQSEWYTYLRDTICEYNTMKSKDLRRIG